MATRLSQRVALLLLALVCCGAEAANVRQRENAIKSGFIYNFARYSQGEWFNAKRSKYYTVCSFDPQFVDIAIQTLNERLIDNVPIKVHLLASESSPLVACNTLFITKEDAQKWAYLVTHSKPERLMLIGELPDFIASGGHINFFIVGGKVRFEVNPAGLKKAGIKMSSKVLRLGRPYNGGDK